MKPIFHKVLVCLLGLGLFACSGDKSPANSESDIKITKTVNHNSDTEACQAKIAVEGMSCSKMCTGAIKSCLSKMEGVKNTTVYFDPERKKTDYAALEFDQNKISEKEMIAAIEKLNDGQYKVKSVEIVINEVSYEKIEEKPDKKEAKSNPKISALPGVRLVVPSLVFVVSKWVR